MKRRMLSLIITAVFAVTTLSAQDLQEILDTYFETIGQEKLLDVETIVSTGKAMQMGQEMPFKFIAKRPDKAYIEIDIMDTKMKQGYDGENGWAVLPWTGSSEPVDLVGPELRGLKDMSDLDGPLWEYEKKGHKCELLDPEEIDGSEVFVLKLTKKDGDIEYYYMDSENFVVIKVVSKTIVEGSEVEIEALMSNFQDFDGYIMPLTTEQRMNGQVMMTMNIEEVSRDEEVDDAIFTKPAAPAKPAE